MSSHRSSRHARPLWRSTRLRAALSLGVVLCLGATGTLAYWTDEATITGGTFQSGILDLTAGPTTGAENLTGTGPNSWTYSALAISDMLPGDSVSKTVVLKNSGGVPLRLNGVVTTTTNDLGVVGTPAQGLQIIIVDGATASASTTDPATGVRTGGCGAGTSVYTGNPTTTSTTAIYSSPPTLAAGQTRSVCVRAILPTAAPNAVQNKSTAVKLSMTASQLGAP